MAATCQIVPLYRTDDPPTGMAFGIIGDVEFDAAMATQTNVQVSVPAGPSTLNVVKQNQQLINLGGGAQRWLITCFATTSRRTGGISDVNITVTITRTPPNPTVQIFTTSKYGINP